MPATNARKKLLDSSERNSLIYIGLTRKPCGLTAVLNETGAERECENGEKTCRPAAEVARYEVRKNPQEPAQTRGSRQKKANWRTSWFFNLVVEYGRGFKSDLQSLEASSRHLSALLQIARFTLWQPSDWR